MIRTEIKSVYEAKNQGYSMFPVMGEIFSDVVTPVEGYKRLHKGEASFLFESTEGDERQSHYSFIGIRPKAEIMVKDGVVEISGNNPVTIRTDQPDDVIRSYMEKYKSPDCGLPFSGGLAGYFSFEYFKYGQKIDMPAAPLGDARLFLFDEIVAFDNVLRKIFIVVNMDLSVEIESGFSEAVKRIEEIIYRLRHGVAEEYEPLEIESGFLPTYTKEQYCERVKKAKHYIKEGDIFQCVPANRWTARGKGSLFGAYRVMRVRNPSPYMIYMNFDGMEIAGASPETLVKKVGETVFTFPIAGTRPRGATPEEDEALEAELNASKKENAEHDMLVDLGRNDLGKICTFGSVRVDNYKKIYRFSHVMHMTSCVSGQMRDGLSPVDALRATLPAGTLSGAPKRRAVEIIRELEDYIPRGIYGGAVGYISFTGDGDFCIAIRSAVKQGDKIVVCAGGGVVDGSVPEDEYAESCNKYAAAGNAVLNSREADL